MGEFTQLVPETNKFYEPLLKIFKKKIKRQKKKAVTEGEDDEEGSEEVMCQKSPGIPKRDLLTCQTITGG